MTPSEIRKLKKGDQVAVQVSEIEPHSDFPVGVTCEDTVYWFMSDCIIRKVEDKEPVIEISEKKNNEIIDLRHEVNTLSLALSYIKGTDLGYPILNHWLFYNTTEEQDNKNQQLFAKIWSNEINVVVKEPTPKYWVHVLPGEDGYLQVKKTHLSQYEIETEIHIGNPGDEENGYQFTADEISEMKTNDDFKGICFNDETLEKVPNIVLEDDENND